MAGGLRSRWRGRRIYLREEKGFAFLERATLSGSAGGVGWDGSGGLGRFGVFVEVVPRAGFGMPVYEIWPLSGYRVLTENS